MTHAYTLTVRDYEVDSYGGVNNATFLNYMEEGRKLYLATIGLDLRALFYKNIGFVVTRYEIDYLRSLAAGDEVEIETSMTRLSRLKFRFEQNIYLLPGRVPVVKAINIGVPINVAKNRAEWAPELDALLGHFPVPQKA